MWIWYCSQNQQLTTAAHSVCTGLLLADRCPFQLSVIVPVQGKNQGGSHTTVQSLLSTQVHFLAVLLDIAGHLGLQQQKVSDCQILQPQNF